MPRLAEQMTAMERIEHSMINQRKKYKAQRRELDAANRAAGRFCDFDDDMVMTGDWDWGADSWTRYIGPRLQKVWNTLTPELRHLIADDFSERADSDWSDGIDAMGEDA